MHCRKVVADTTIVHPPKLNLLVAFGKEREAIARGKSRQDDVGSGQKWRGSVEHGGGGLLNSLYQAVLRMLVSSLGQLAYC